MIGRLKNIILDTNFMLLPAQKKRDIFSFLREGLDFSYRLFVLDKTISELEKIASHKSKDGMNARFTLRMINELKGEVEIISSEGLKNKERTVDDMLVELDGMGFIVATQDRLLRKRLKKSICFSSDKIITKGI